MSGGITGCRRGMLRVRDWLAYLGLLVPSDQFGRKRRGVTGQNRHSSLPCGTLLIKTTYAKIR